MSSESNSPSQGSIHLGIDVGSTTVKVVVLDASRRILTQRYIRANGQPRGTLLRTLTELSHDFDFTAVRSIGFTGSGGGPIARHLNVPHINELIAQTRAVSEFYPTARTVIEIGGQDSKLLILERDEANQRTLLVDFAMNTLCAAGTGSFLDQQAERLGIAIENEFGELAVQSTSPARIAGRCTVFAKSDMIHLQQKAVPLTDIIAGLCHALARNFHSVIGGGRPFEPPILFQGGVAYNRGVVRAFENVLGLEPGSLIIPRQHTVMAALGAAFEAMDHVPVSGLDLTLLAEIARVEAQGERTTLPPLLYRPRPAAPPMPDLNEDALPVYLGIDVGSISTNVILLDEQRRIVARRYLRTAGRPLEAVRRGLLEIGTETAGRVRVVGVGVTGSGRHLTGDYVGADAVRNEITAQATAAAAIDPTVDTIFEIGGQDSKYIRLADGAVVDFTMNKACAAGTGSFLEEQAERLKLNIERDFSDLALAAACPAALGERCTVFMESDLIHHQQQGAAVGDLTAGLAYSVAQNYLNKVVNGRPVGQRVFFQGGVASNAAVVAAFEQLIGRPVVVPPHHDVTGAIGAAILAMQEMEDSAAPTHFKGFDLSDRAYTTTTFSCKGCTNLCEINRVAIQNEQPLFYGARCEKYESAGRSRPSASTIPDLFAERLSLLLDGYDPEAARKAPVRLGIPRTLTFFDLFPFWRGFFDTLNIGLILSEPTHPATIRRTEETAASEACFPVKIVYGHVQDLVTRDVQFIFMPGVANRENPAPGQTHNAYCPLVQAAPWLVSAQMDLAAHNVRPLHFPVHLLWEKTVEREMEPLAEALGLSMAQIRRALTAARESQAAFYARIRRRGDEVLAGLGPDRPGVVIIGRPYNVNDPGLNQDLPFQVRRLGILPIPMDYLPLRSVDISDRFDNMFWRSGQDILAAARLIRTTPHLHAIYMTNFGCGPDSFLLSFFQRELDKPFLELELDAHNADAGLVTRCEAFFDSLRLPEKEKSIFSAAF